MSADALALPEEALVQLVLSNGFSIPLICSPENLRELVVGWLFTQGLVDGWQNIHSIQICDDNRRVLVQVKNENAEVVNSFRAILGSGCSGSQVNAEKYRAPVPICNSPLTTNMHELKSIIRRLLDAAYEHPSSRGVHCAGLATPGNDSFEVWRDIGRHNAVDKAIGSFLKMGCEFGDSILATSGRISSDMILKAIRAGIPIIVTQRSVTNLAAELAARAKIAIVGRLSKADPIIAGNRGRIQP